MVQPIKKSKKHFKRLYGFTFIKRDLNNKEQYDSWIQTLNNIETESIFKYWHVKIIRPEGNRRWNQLKNGNFQNVVNFSRVYRLTKSFSFRIHTDTPRVCVNEKPLINYVKQNPTARAMKNFI